MVCEMEMIGFSLWLRWESDRYNIGSWIHGKQLCNTECLPQNNWRVLLDSVVKAHHLSYAIELDGTLA